MLVLDALDFGLDGKLTARATQLLRVGYPIDRVAATVHREFGLDCSHSTVNRWVTRLSATVEPPKATTVAKSKRRAS